VADEASWKGLCHGCCGYVQRRRTIDHSPLVAEVDIASLGWGGRDSAGGEPLGRSQCLGPRRPQRADARRSAPERALDVVVALLAAGAVGLLVCARQARQPSQPVPVWGARAALLGAATGVLGNAFLTVVQVHFGAERPYRWLLWVMLLLGCAAVVVAVWPHVHLADLPRPKGSVGASVGLVAALVGFLTTNVVTPAATPGLVSVAATFGKPVLGPDGPRIMLPFTASLTNPSKVKVWIPASTYSVLGRHGSPLSSHSSADPAASVAAHQPLAAYGSSLRYDLVAADQVTTDGTYLQPNETLTVTRVLTLPADTHPFDLYRLTVNAVVLRGDRARVVGSAPLVAEAAQPYVKWHWKIEDPNGLAALTRRQRDMFVWWHLALPQPFDPPGYSLLPLLAPPGHEYDRSSPGIPIASVNDNEHYGFAQVGGTTEVSAADLMSAARPQPKSATG